MSYEVVRDVFNFAAPKNSGAMLVLLALAERADNVWRECYPSVARIAWETNLSTRMVQSHLDSLIETGFITRDRNAGPKGTNLYKIHVVDAWVCVKSPFKSAVDRQGDVKHISPPAKAADAKWASKGGEAGFQIDKKPTSPEPSVEPSVEPSYVESAEIIRLRGKGPQPTKQVFREEDFSDFWTVFPDTGHKNDPTATKALFRKIVTGEIEVIAPVTPSGLIDAARSYADTNPKYAMKPANWLEKEAWASHQGAGKRRRGGQAIPYFGEITR